MSRTTCGQHSAASGWYIRSLVGRILYDGRRVACKLGKLQRRRQVNRRASISTTRARHVSPRHNQPRATLEREPLNSTAIGLPSQPRYKLVRCNRQRFREQDVIIENISEKIDIKTVLSHLYFIWYVVHKIEYMIVHACTLIATHYLNIHGSYKEIECKSVYIALFKLTDIRTHYIAYI